MFLMANRAEEDNPWAIIIVIVPERPILVSLIVPAIRRPMWPTEE